MEVSYGKFAEKLTELKMDHQFGALKSERLTEFLDQILWCFEMVGIYFAKPPIETSI